MKRRTSFALVVLVVATWLGAGGAGATARPFAPAPAPAPRDQAPVVIVGAGLTGLTTAFELRKAGIDVMVLEASARAGGRIQTVAFADGARAEAHMEEFWERSPAYGLLKELKLPLVATVAHSAVRIGGKVYPYRGNGDRDTYLRGIFSDAEREAMRRWNDKVWGLYQRLHQQHFQEHGALDAELTALQKVSFADFVRRDGLPEKVGEWIRVTLEPEIAVEWDAISALDGIDEMRVFLDSPQGFGEKNFHVGGGNGRFVDALLDRIGRQRIVLQAEVTAVEQIDGGVRVRYLHEGARYREVEARAAVVTVPLPALGRIQFIPPLGPEKRKAIETTRFGAYVKVHVRVAPEGARAWASPDGAPLLTMLSDSPAGSIYDTGDFQRRGPLGDRCLTLLIHARFARPMLSMNADQMRDYAVGGLDQLFPGVAAHVRQTEIFVYPNAVAYWPVALGRSRFDALAADLRRPEGAIWIGGDTTESSHSEGAVQAALRMAGELAAMKAVLGKPLRHASPVVRQGE